MWTHTTVKKSQISHIPCPFHITKYSLCKLTWTHNTHIGSLITRYIPVWLQISLYPLQAGEVSSGCDIHISMWYSDTAATAKWKMPVRSPLSIAVYINHQIFVQLLVVQRQVWIKCWCWCIQNENTPKTNTKNLPKFLINILHVSFFPSFNVWKFKLLKSWGYEKSY